MTTETSSSQGPQEYKECRRCRKNLPQTREFFYFRHGRREKEMASYMCKPCFIIKEKEDWYKNHEKNKAYLRERTRRIRKLVLEHYGLKCVCCGEKEYQFLAIDHINNDGAEHRRLIKTNNVTFWLYKNGFPPGFQTLCHNCNTAKGHYGQCPHLKAKSIVDNGA